MGFHKRFITREIIESTDNEQIGTLFTSDALIFSDDWSYNFYELFLDGVEINKIKEKLTNYENNKKES
jgi:hypothetical protein